LLFFRESLWIRVAPFKLLRERVPTGRQIEVLSPHFRVRSPLGLEESGVRHLPVLLYPFFYGQQLKRMTHYPTLQAPGAPWVVNARARGRFKHLLYKSQSLIPASGMSITGVNVAHSAGLYLLSLGS